MDLRGYLKAIRKSWWMVVIATILGAGLAVAYIAKTPPTYASSVTFFVNTTSDTGTNPLQSDQYAQERVTSYVHLMSSDRLAKLIVADTQIDESPTDVAESITAESPLNTVLLTATVTSTSPSRSLAIAKSISTQFVKMIGEIDSTVQLQVTSGPALNPSPVSPRKKVDLGLGILAGLVIGVGSAILRELLDTTVRSVATLRSLTGAAVLGSIGRDKAAKKAPLIVDSHAKSIRAEAFRQLRTNLQFIDVTRPANVIVVTSSIAGEGKSTTAANLAVIFAEAGRRVLLIEGDLRRPKIADYLGLERAMGLTNVLAGQVPVNDVLQPWGRGVLTVLPSGSIPPNPSELLGSGSMDDLLDELRRTFNTIIIDTPPLLPVTDAAVAAVGADGAVLVVRYGKTKRAQVAAALHALESVDARVLGCVLNMAPMKGTDAYLAYDGYAFDVDEPAVPSLVGRASAAPARAEPSPADQEAEDARPTDGVARRGPIDVGSDGTAINGEPREHASADPAAVAER